MRSNSDNLADSTPIGCSAAGPLMVDIHCHCLPGVDDGPQDMQQALDLCRQMVAEGITAAIATPHQLGAYDRRNSASDIRAITANLNEVLTTSDIPLIVHPGGEVRIDSRLLELLEKDTILTLADKGRHLLLELPGEPLMDLQPVLRLLRDRGIVAVIAHPERIRSVRRRLELLKTWSQQGALLQINAASLVGAGGPGDCDMAWTIVNAGLADAVASDCHNITYRRPMLAKARQLLLDRAGYALTRRICCDNPFAILAGGCVNSRPAFAAAGARS